MGRNRDGWYKQRRAASIPVRTNNLIICVGEQTEKNYFLGAVNYFYKDENARRNVYFEVVVDSVDPLNMARNAKNKVIETSNRIKQNIDHVWVVFDKDDFPQDNFDNTIYKLIEMSDDKTKYHPLWSNKCFELWMLLNFVNNQAALLSNEYIDKLTEVLGFKYKKNDVDIFKEILDKKGRITVAIRYAKRLLDKNISPSSNNPATTVFEFFEFYYKYLGIR